MYKQLAYFFGLVGVLGLMGCGSAERLGEATAVATQTPLVQTVVYYEVVEVELPVTRQVTRVVERPVEVTVEVEIEVTRLVTVSATPTIETAASENAEDLQATLLASASLFAEPTAEAEELAVLATGAEVLVLGRNRTGSWLYVATADEVEGFVFAERVGLGEAAVAGLPLRP